MDHIAQPVDPVASSARVAYLAEPYDGGGFLDYQTRHPMLESHSLEQRQSYLQTWLYFGLLHEILGDIFNLENYVDRDEQGPVIRTNALNPDFNLWIKRMGKLDEEQKHRTMRHIQECFSLWHQVVLQNHWSLDFRHGLLPDYDRGFRQSLAALGETVYWTFKLVYRRHDLALHTAWASLYTDETTVPTMQRHGWCPNEASRLLRSTVSVSVKHFAARISKPGPERPGRHRHCTTQTCSHAQIDVRTYRPRHVGGCDCEEIGPDLGSVVACLSGDGFPVLQISGDDVSDLRIDVVRWSENEVRPYVAISHVWADGLGNPFAMKLPRCQLLRLQESVGKLEGYRGADGHGRLSLWCDTLCCPVEDHLKSLALEKMRAVYEKATYVLILDSSLLPYEYGKIGPIETSIRLLSSPWTGRLWTMQESALAKRLLVQLADQFVDVDDLVWEANKGYGAWLKTHAIGRGLMMGLNELRDIMQTDADSVRLRLSNVFGAVRFRQVTFKSDEPVCLATLLDLDLSSIVRADADDRMKVFWNLMSNTTQGIPKDIVFNLGLGRVRHQGFRWAPSTFMHGLDGPAEMTEMLTNGSPERMASLTPQGISVSYPAWELTFPSTSSRAMSDHDSLLKVLWGVVRLRHSNGDWYKISVLSPDWSANNSTLWDCCASSRENLILVFPELPLSEHHAARGVLGSVSGCESGEEVVRTITVVGAMRASSHEQAMWSAGLSAGKALREGPSIVDDGPEGDRSSLQGQAWGVAQGMLQDVTALNSMSSIPRLSEDRSLYDSVLAELVMTIIIGHEGHYLTVGREFQTERRWTID